MLVASGDRAPLDHSLASGAGMSDEPQRMSAWEATLFYA